MGDSVIEEAMIASSLMEDAIIDGTYDDYADMSSFSANLCDVVQEDMGMYDAPDEQDMYNSKTKRLICKRCGKAFRNKILLKKHTAMHTKDNVFDCEECDKKFSRKESLTRHMLVHSGMKFYECFECGRMFNQNGHLRTHMLTHTKEKNFQCDSCNMKFARKDNLKRHYLLHSRKKSFECSICAKRFNQNGHLESHMLTHTQEKNFECEQCFMKFARRDTLKRHMLVHTREKAFECDSCSAKFVQNSHLKAHLLVHTREKKFNCPDCDKSFARKGSLKRHMCVHTGERNFECTECGKTFVQKTHLNKHQSIHSGTRDKMNDENVDEFLENINKVEVHILSPSKVGKNGKPVKRRNRRCLKNSQAGKGGGSKKGTSNSATNNSVNTQAGEASKADPSLSADGTACKVKDESAAVSKPGSGGKPASGDQNASKNQSASGAQPVSGSGSASGNQPVRAQQGTMTNIQQQNSLQPVGVNNVHCPPGDVRSPPVNIESENPDGSQMQPNNLLANSNSVMALALLDHFLTGNESQENVAAAEESGGKGKGNNQWGQKTQQELLAAQTLSAIGQRASVVNENHQGYPQAPCINPQMPSCNMQPVPQGVLASGPAAAMKIRPPAGAQWIPQDKALVHPQNIVYNVPPPAHEIFRYYSPANMPLHHPSNRYPDGSCIPADMRATPRKPKYPQKVLLSPGEWQQMPMHPGGMNATMPMYAHTKHPSDPPRMLDRP
ncbi:zinc finger protein 347-like [Macrobrachium nipponense]|uniref:zinc finger protein 347-like n=1 Tax=Macrobrachium nipponense TaxID=159736 RepID=UPI0030C7F1C7